MVFVDGNTISDLDSQFPRKQAGGYQAGTAGTKREPRGNQEETKREPRGNQEGTRGNQDGTRRGPEGTNEKQEAIGL